jgi:dephospho-CoA kinase
MLIVGLTGGFCTGKSTVAEMFKNLGARIIDLDDLSHKAIRPKSSSYRKILRHFGRAILHPDGKIDRKKLAGIAFEDTDRLRLLCEIVHPEVIKGMKRQIRFFKKKEKGHLACVVVEAPLLFEAGLDKMMNKTVVVKIPRAVQFKRARASRGLKTREISKRIKAQMPLRTKIRLADFVIDNSGSTTHTEEQVKKIWREILKGCIDRGRASVN